MPLSVQHSNGKTVLFCPSNVPVQKDTAANTECKYQQKVTLALAGEARPVGASSCIPNGWGTNGKQPSDISLSH